MHDPNTCKVEHCMRDECIAKRVREEVARRDAEKQAAAYVQRRGGPPGTVTLSDAIRQARGNV